MLLSLRLIFPPLPLHAVQFVDPVGSRPHQWPVCYLPTDGHPAPYAIIFVVDSSAVELLPRVKQELHTLLDEPALRDTLFIVQVRVASTSVCVCGHVCARACVCVCLEPCRLKGCSGVFVAPLYDLRPWCPHPSLGLALPYSVPRRAAQQARQHRTDGRNLSLSPPGPRGRQGFQPPTGVHHGILPAWNRHC